MSAPKPSKPKPTLRPQPTAAMAEKKQNFRVDNVKSSPIPSEITPKARWGKQFEREWGFAFKLPHGNTVAVFMDKRLRSGDYSTIMEILGEESNAAYIITCEGNEWVVKTEPIGKDSCGITVYTTKGKAMMAGTCRVKKSGEWLAEIKTLYPWIRNKPKKMKAYAKVTAKSDGTAEGTAGVEIEF
jgi:hypothetical protein